jgi:hypothetical protein
VRAADWPWPASAALMALTLAELLDVLAELLAGAGR